MVKILESQLEEGLSLATSIFNCNYSIHCLFGEILIEDFEECTEKGKCKLFQFRKMLELYSPALYERIQNLSEYEETILSIMEELHSLSDEMKKSGRKLQDLCLFSEIFIASIYTLYLAGGMIIPFLSSERINKIDRKIGMFSKKRTRKELIKIRSINREWFNWISNVSINFNDYERFAPAINQIIYLFVNSMLNNYPTMDEKAFEEIQNGINGINKRERG